MSTVRISDDDKLILNDLCEKRGMTQGVVVGYLLEQAVRYNMFDSDWIEELTEVTFHDLLQEADLDYRKGFEVARYKAELNLKSTLIKELIKAMPPVERVAYLKETLGGHEKGVDLIESMSSQQMYSVNGEKKMIAPGQDGRPRIHNLAPGQIIQCPRGWHTKHNPCVACDICKTCEIVFDERVEWLGQHGTTKEREEVIANSSVRRLN